MLDRLRKFRVSEVKGHSLTSHRHHDSEFYAGCLKCLVASCDLGYWGAGYVVLMLLFLCGISSCSRLNAQISKPDALFAYDLRKAADTGEAQQRIVLDGKLDELPWKMAHRISNFTQRNLYEGEPATERTEAAVLYDDDHLYIGIWCYDRNPGDMLAFEQRRDFQWWREENINIVLDTYRDRRNGYLFVTNPYGARADALIIDNGEGFNTDWNGVWDAAAVKTDSGWFAEILIPFTTLKFSDATEQVWGINFERNIRHKREQIQWQGWARDASIEQLNRAGTLMGLSNIRSVNLIELKPYLLSGAQQLDGASLLWERNIGADLNYLITPTLKFNITTNTDFAQVEVDQAQINFTRFPLFFPEKREFFLEGRDLFDFGGDAVGFYSRRIGLSEGGEPIQILGGARLLGKEEGTTIGALSMQTARAGDAPGTNYSAFSIRQDVFEQSRIGLVGTTKVLEGKQNFTYGANARLATDTFLDNKNLVFDASFIQSYTSDAVSRQGNSMTMGVYYPNDLFDLGLEAAVIDNAFNPEVGFLWRKNYRRVSGNIGYRPRPSELPFVQQLFFVPLNAEAYWNHETGDFESGNYEFTPLGVLFTSGDSFTIQVTHERDRPPSAFPIGRVIIIEPGEYGFTRASLGVQSFNGRAVSGGIRIQGGEFYGGQRVSLSGNSSIRFNRFVSFFIFFEHNEIQFPGVKLITNQIVSRTDVSLTPSLFGGLFAQWNDNDRQALFNLRLTWIPTIGTDFFFVFTQGFDSSEGFRSTGTSVLAKLVWRFIL